ncbi:MAG: GIY-YIG nuclease family protein, partial [Robiginitomaculum sp.]|nr:GIY-YIG nuclease family protein [Robiginitomaculum sp.]
MSQGFEGGILLGDILRLAFVSNQCINHEVSFRESKMNTNGRSLELFFINGKPDQMLTAEVFGWTGHILMIPRTELAKGPQRKESRHTGVYLLIGEDEQGQLAYIGEAENVASRIKDHDSKKDWWTSVVLITSTANNLHKAHAKYLEARLVEITQSVGKIKLENGNAPSRPSLSESAIANMEVFLEHILLVLPALRVDFLLSKARPSARSMEIQSEKPVIEFELVSKNLGCNATAVLKDGE